MVLLSPWMSNKASVRSISSSIVVGGRGIDSSHNTMGSQVVSTGSHNGRLISRGDSTVSIGNQGGDMERSSISVSSSIGSRGSSNNRGNCSISSSIAISGSISSFKSSILGGQMVSTGSSHSRLISRSDSSIRVRDQGRDVKGTSISISSSIGSRGSSNHRGSCSISGSIAISYSITSSIDSVLGGQMVSTGSCNCRLINRGDCSIRMGLQSVESRGSCGSNASSKNQKLHIVCC